MVQSAQAEVGFDDFNVKLVDDDIDVGDDFELILIFEDPDNTETVQVEVEIIMDSVTVYNDDDLDISFTEGENKNISIKSTSFPGPDLKHNYWKLNLMNYNCDDFDVEVSLTGSDLEDDLSGDDRLTIGDNDDELTFEMDPDSPTTAEEIVFTVFDDRDDELEDATVKITWIDDSSGDEDGEWDSDDDSWNKKTDNDGEVAVTLEDKFDASASGEFQVDVYADGFCLARDTFEISNELLVEVSKGSVEIGEGFSVCVKNSAGNAIYSAAIYVYGPGYAKTYYTSTDGCKSLTISTPGTYDFTVTKSGYDENGDEEITINQKQTTTTTARATTSTSTIEATTTLKDSETKNELKVSTDRETVGVGEQVIVMVKDEEGKPVLGVKITVSPDGLEGVTDFTGTFSFNASEAGLTEIKAEKKDMVSATTHVKVQLESETGDSTEQNETIEDEGIKEDEGFFSTGAWITIVLVLLVLVVLAAAILGYLFYQHKKEGRL
ncbi:MAG: carboxypeptidase-like regulatory domain-containing protein [Candidatus Altiarchaeota archaeon]